MASITNFSVGFDSLSPLRSMQVAKASCCAESCSVLRVSAKGELLPQSLVCVGVCVGKGEMKTLGCTLQQSTTS